MYNKAREKMMIELSRFIGDREDLTRKDLEDLANQIKNGKIFPKSQLTPQQLAEDLVFEAHELVSKNEMDLAGKKIEKALELNPNSIEAYEILAKYSADAERHVECLSRAIYIGMELFPEAYLMKNGGNFWGVIETRPFMRCFKMLADHYFFSGDTVKAADYFENMILLNKKDDQGVRFQLLPALLELGDFKKFQQTVAKRAWQKKEGALAWLRSYQVQFY
ncbi:hypothetical protein AGMMS49525_06990 [Bacteroidia bacterium]|nr:hypothetical protein AGMMS49525_06990 [Bacteroidia bacterium]